MKKAALDKEAKKTGTNEDIGTPLGQQIRRYIFGMIKSGEWSEGDKIPSEPQLVAQFGISRMTVHIALRDLAAEGHLIRRQGSGTFVAPRRSQSTFMQLRNIKEEIEERNGTHSTKILTLQAIDCELSLATELDVIPGTKLFHSVIVHHENGEPIQLEDRYVNPGFAPSYLEQDFEASTPNEYLMNCGPLTEVEHVVQAIPADTNTGRLLKVSEGDAILLIRRRTWSDNTIATSVRLRHPGARFSLVGRMGQ